MGKLLSWLGLFAIGWFVYKFVVISQRKSARPPGASPSGAGGASAGAGTPGGSGAPAGARELAGEAMVQCAHCGVYLPVSESLVSGADHFCCPAHRDARVRSQDR